MDQNIKNRLVGIIVIFALAVIFLPMILDGSGVNKEKLEVVIPPQPVVTANPEFEAKVTELNDQVEAIAVLEPRYVDENSSANAIEPDTSSDSSSDTSSSVDEAEPATKTGGDSWVLQLGSYQDRSKALAQRDKIRKSNIAAVFVEQINIDDKTSYRVRLGPFINREQTRVALNKIKAKYDIDGIIMKYER